MTAYDQVRTTRAKPVKALTEAQKKSIISRYTSPESNLSMQTIARSMKVNIELVRNALLEANIPFKKTRGCV
jgi:hypothetical protein